MGVTKPYNPRSAMMRAIKAFSCVELSYSTFRVIVGVRGETYMLTTTQTWRMMKDGSMTLCDTSESSDVRRALKESLR